jgi:hypothetical protein
MPMERSLDAEGRIVGNTGNAVLVAQSYYYGKDISSEFIARARTVLCS